MGLIENMRTSLKGIELVPTTPKGLYLSWRSFQDQEAKSYEGNLQPWWNHRHTLERGGPFHPLECAGVLLQFFNGKTQGTWYAGKKPSLSTWRVMDLQVLFCQSYKTMRACITFRSKSKRTTQFISLVMCTTSRTAERPRSCPFPDKGITNSPKYKDIARFKRLDLDLKGINI